MHSGETSRHGVERGTRPVEEQDLEHVNGSDEAANLQRMARG
jgi:hypothetical protein